MARTSITRQRTGTDSRAGSSQTITYTSTETYFDSYVYIVGSDTGQTMSLPSGTHEFPFQFILPQNIPSSFEGKCGYVRYTIKASLDKPWKFDHTTKLAFTVINHVDLNFQRPDLKLPARLQEEKDVSFCCCVSGRIFARVVLNRRCFVPGDKLAFNATIENKANRPVMGIKAGIKQFCHFVAEGRTEDSSENVCFFDINEEIQPGATKQYQNMTLTVPPLPASELIPCNIIHIGYMFRLLMRLDWAPDMEVASDVVIGTIPLRESLVPFNQVIDSQPMPAGPPPAAGWNNLAPPSYRECVGGKVTIKESDDSEYTRGNLMWAPSYPTYSLPEPSAPPS